MSDNGRLVMTIAEFTEAAGISKKLAYSLARADRLPVPVIKLGKRIVLSRRAVLALLEGNGKEGN